MGAAVDAPRKRLDSRGFLALWALVLIGVFAQGLVVGRVPRVPFPFTALSSLVLVAWAWSNTRGIEGDERRFRVALARGMTCGFFGDLAMAAGAVFVAIPIFGVGHVLYLRSARALGGASESRAFRLAALLLYLSVGFATYALLVQAGTSRAAESTMLVVATGLYTGLLAAMAGTAAGYARTSTRFVVMALGGTLFLLSDAVIALRMFTPSLFAMLPDPPREDLVWLTYGPAQMLIVASGVLGGRDGRKPQV